MRDTQQPKKSPVPGVIATQGKVEADAESAERLRNLKEMIKNAKNSETEGETGEPTVPDGKVLPRVSPQTLKDIQQLADAQDQPEETEGQKTMTPQEELSTLLGQMDLGLSMGMGESSLRNGPRKKLIDQRCAERAKQSDRDPLSLMLSKGYIIGEVPVIPGKFELTFRTTMEMEEAELLKIVSGMKGSDRYLQRHLLLCQLCAALVAINGVSQGEHLVQGQDGKLAFSLEKFTAKLSRISRYPRVMIEELAVQYEWFDERVRRSFLESDLKNG